MENNIAYDMADAGSISISPPFDSKALDAMRLSSETKGCPMAINYGAVRQMLSCWIPRWSPIGKANQGSEPYLRRRDYLVAKPNFTRSSCLRNRPSRKAVNLFAEDHASGL